MITAKQIADSIDFYVVGEKSQQIRTYLGLSAIGDDCLRKVFLSWRFAKIEQFSGRMYRLFDRGNREEATFVNLLRAAGHKVLEKDEKTGKQFEINLFYGYVKGHTDGEIYIEKTPWLLEMKTHNNKSFLKLQRSKSIKIAKYQHYIQMQSYMGYLGFTHGLYTAVNKDNDLLYFEIIAFNKNVFDDIKDKLNHVVNTSVIPRRLSENGTFWKCSCCIFNDFCFNNGKILRSCRMCKKISMPGNNKWYCTHKNKNMSLNEQLKGCKKFVCLPG